MPNLKDKVLHSMNYGKECSLYMSKKSKRYERIQTNCEENCKNC